MSDIRPGIEFARLAVLSIIAGAVLAGLGYWPTVNLAGPQALPAMVAGIAVALVGVLIGVSIPVWSIHTAPAKRHNAILIGMTARMLATILIGSAVALSGGVAVKPLLLWVAIAYLMFLAIDTIGVVWLYQRCTRDEQG